MNKNSSFVLFNFFLFSLLVGACARINMDSREYYEHKNKIRHGIIPIETSSSDRGEEYDRVEAKRALDVASVQRGKVLFESHCMSCHGPQGRGDGPAASDFSVRPPNLQESVRQVRQFEFYMALSQWKGDMPGWEFPFSDEERKDLAQYLKSLVL